MFARLKGSPYLFMRPEDFKILRESYSQNLQKRQKCGLKLMRMVRAGLLVLAVYSKWTAFEP